MWSISDATDSQTALISSSIIQIDTRTTTYADWWDFQWCLLNQITSVVEIQWIHLALRTVFGPHKNCTLHITQCVKISQWWSISAKMNVNKWLNDWMPRPSRVKKANATHTLSYSHLFLPFRFLPFRSLAYDDGAKKLLVGTDSPLFFSRCSNEIFTHSRQQSDNTKKNEWLDHSSSEMDTTYTHPAICVLHWFLIGFWPDSIHVISIYCIYSEHTLIDCH